MKIHDVRMVMVSLIVPADDKIIDVIDQRWEETRSSLTERRKRQVQGQEVFGLTEDCSVVTLFDDLTQAGFDIVGATAKMLLDRRWQVRFEFVPREDTEENLNLRESQEEFERVRPRIEEGLKTLCQRSFWYAQVWDNPFFLNGHDEPAGRMVSIVLKNRQPRFRPPGGVPVTKWRVDEFGQRIGDAPVPIRPKHRLVIMDNRIQLVPA